MITFEEIRRNREVRAYMHKGDANLGALGFTEHGGGHAMKVAHDAAAILTALGFGAREIELARIAGYMHDLGNCINRHDHAHTGALVAMQILTRMGMEPEEIAIISAAIGNHDEKTGVPVDAVSAALILADKCDVRRSRVRPDADFDIHDRVNYAAEGAEMETDGEKRVITLSLELDDKLCSVMDYFQIFTERMLMCRRAAGKLDCEFRMIVNGVRVV